MCVRRTKHWKEAAWSHSYFVVPPVARNSILSWWLKPQQKFSGIKQLVHHVEPARAVNEKCFCSLLVSGSSKSEAAPGVRRSQEQRVATMQVRQHLYSWGTGPQNLNQASRTKRWEQQLPSKANPRNPNINSGIGLGPGPSTTYLRGVQDATAWAEIGPVGPWSGWGG